MGRPPFFSFQKLRGSKGLIYEIDSSAQEKVNFLIPHEYLSILFVIESLFEVILLFSHVHV